MGHAGSGQITKQGIARLLGISPRQAGTLTTMGVIRPEGTRFSLADAEELAQNAARRTYVTGLKNTDLSKPFALLFPLSDPELSPKLELSWSNGRQKAIDALGRPLAEGEFVAGWTAIADDMLEILLADHRPLLGVTGSIVTDVAEIVDLAYTDPINRRRALVVRTMVNSDRYLGRVTRMNQSGTYANVPA